MLAVCYLLFQRHRHFAEPARGTGPRGQCGLWPKHLYPIQHHPRNESYIIPAEPLDEPLGDGERGYIRLLVVHIGSWQLLRRRQPTHPTRVWCDDVDARRLQPRHLAAPLQSHSDSGDSLWFNAFPLDCYSSPTNRIPIEYVVAPSSFCRLSRTSQHEFAYSWRHGSPIRARFQRPPHKSQSQLRLDACLHQLIP